MLILVIFLLFLSINCVICQNVTVLNLPEGSNCTYENIPGKCVNIYKCERLALYLLDKKSPPLCSFDGYVPVVCCTSCKLVDNINDAIRVSAGFIYWKTGDISHDKCLEYSKYALGKCHKEGGPHLYWNKTLNCHELDSWYYLGAGGVDAKAGEMPHMALLGYGDELEDLQWRCGGTLISEKFILTAGHCAKSDLFGPVTYAALGILKRDDPSEIWQRYKVKTIIVHPEYRPPVKYHDIALLETEHRVKLSPLVIPGCLPNKDRYVNDPALVKKIGDTWSQLEVNLRLSAAGWGAIGFRKALANTLQVIRVRGFNETECLEHYPPHANIPHGYNKTTQLCFGDRKKPIDTCEGDSGGPLQDLNDYCMYTVLGVTSFGRACGFAGNAGIYTRVLHYVPWIESIIWK